MDEIQVKLEATMADLIKEHQLRLAEFTDVQLKDVLVQLVRSGDIVRYTQLDLGAEGAEKSAAFYIPFRGVEELRARYSWTPISQKPDYSKSYYLVVVESTDLDRQSLLMGVNPKKVTKAIDVYHLSEYTLNLYTWHQPIGAKHWQRVTHWMELPELP